MKTGRHILSNSALNIVGTFFYFFCQWATTLLVLYLAGFHEVGVYSLAISFANIFGFVARYGVRQYQVSDINDEHTDAEYLAARGITSLGAVALFAGSLLFYRFNVQSLFCAIIMLLFKLLESATDVLFGIFQKMTAYWKIAVSYILKGFLPVVMFGGLLYFKVGLVPACLGMAFGYGLVILVHDLPALRYREHFPGRCTRQGVWLILKNCFPLMLFTLLNPYMTFITRYAIEDRFSSEMLGYYSSISMVVVVLSTLAGSIWVVVSPWAATQYKEKQGSAIVKFCLKVVLAIAVFTVLTLVASFWFGSLALGFVFGKDILPYGYLLSPMIVVSALLTLVAYENTLLVAFRKTKALLVLNVMGALACVFSVYPLVDQYGMLGSCFSLIIGISTQAISIGVWIAWLLIKKCR